jgi:hypothetical protein
MTRRGSAGAPDAVGTGSLRGNGTDITAINEYWAGFANASAQSAVTGPVTVTTYGASGLTAYEKPIAPTPDGADNARPYAPGRHPPHVDQGVVERRPPVGFGDVRGQVVPHEGEVVGQAPPRHTDRVGIGTQTGGRRQLGGEPVEKATCKSASRSCTLLRRCARTMSCNSTAFGTRR